MGFQRHFTLLADTRTTPFFAFSPIILKHDCRYKCTEFLPQVDPGNGTDSLEQNRSIPVQVDEEGMLQMSIYSVVSKHARKENCQQDLNHKQVHRFIIQPTQTHLHTSKDCILNGCVNTGIYYIN